MAALHSPTPGAAVAIVGIGCRFPGGVVDPASYWTLLRDGIDAIAEIPPSRFDLAHYYDAQPATPGRVMTRWGGFLDQLEDFDADFFGISPREAGLVDPQQRVLLELAWEALEDAGQDVAALAGSPTAVYIGQWVSDFEARLFANPDRVDFPATLGSGRYATSGRISYVFGFRGPSLTIDSACSSSLAAVHLAVRSLRSGEAPLALAGGVNMILQPHITIGYSQSRMMAVDGRCKFGDASGDGYVRSEGAGLVALKLLDRALADGDRIYAVIRGSAINNDGRSSGVMGRPSRVGHEEMLRAAYRDAGVAASQVGYVEAHGTGTRAGDPVEIAALGAVLGEGRTQASRCLIGSVKTNIGHTEGAAGVAGLIKAALSLHHDAVPASLHFVEPNPAVPWADLPFDVPTTGRAWPSGFARRVAGVNSFGIAGTNAHVVLEGAPAAAADAAAPSSRAWALLVCAKRPEALRALAARHLASLEADPAVELDALCWSAATRRTPLEHRAAFVGTSRAELAEALRRYVGGAAASAAGHVSSETTTRKLVFVCPGQGAQWLGMARELLDHEPAFRAALEACDAAARPWLDVSIVDQLRAEPAQAQLERIDVVQPLLVALAIGYAALWRAWGIEPDVVVGHSMGEVAAAHIAGVLDLEQAMRIICRRSALMRRTSGRGAMALVDLSMEETQRRLAGREAQVGIAVSNSPRSCVVSGDTQAVHALLAELEADGVFCRPVKVDVASHSPQMDEPAAELARELSGLIPAAARVPIFSTVLARRAQAGEFGAAYWGTNLRQPVRFAECVQALLADGATAFVELGPHPVLTAAVEQGAASRPVTALACGRRDDSDAAAMLRAAAGLWAAGLEIDWTRVMPAARAPVLLPTYPWQRERHWAREAAPVDARRRGGAKPATLSREQQDWLHVVRWVDVPPLAAPPTEREPSRVLLIADARAGDLQPFGDAFTREQATLQAVASVEEAQAALRGATPTDVGAIVLLASGHDDLPAATLALLRALADRDAGARRLRLVLATSGAQAVTDRPRPRVAVEQATLWGLGRVIAEEHPDLWGGLIDLDPAADAAANAALLAAEVCRGDGENQVALRDGQRFALRLQPLDAEAAVPAEVAWPSEGAWLITGGLGAVGLHLAAAMVAQGVRRLVLVGRSALPPRVQWAATPADSRDGQRIAAVRALEAAGAAVHLLVADVADAAELERALRAYEGEVWPPILGVLHAAGVLEARLATQTDPASLQRMLAPKLDGARNLDRLLPAVQRFVMISSISATLGIPGMASYAAANAGLDALAQDRRARGRHGLSIQSGAWTDTGMHSGASAEQNMRQLNDMGIQGHAPAQGVAVFSALAGRPEAGITVMPVDWPAFLAARRGRDVNLYRGRAPIEAASAAGGSLSGSLSDRLADANAAERRQLIEPIVRAAAGRVLQLAPARIDPRRPLGAMGLNSLMAMELRNHLESALSRPLSATLAWNYPTVEALVAFLCGEAPAAAPRPAPAAAAAAEPVALEAVAQLSDADAARLLRRRR